MRLHLIFAPISNDNKLAVLELGAGTNPPLGLLYLASYVKQRRKEIEVKITDGLLDGYARTLQQVLSFNPDVAGVSFFTPLALSTYHLINELKHSCPNKSLLTDDKVILRYQNCHARESGHPGSSIVVDSR